MKQKKLFIVCLAAAVISVFALAGCSGGKTSGNGLKDGKYVATFTTDSPMFHINDAYDDKGILTVKNGRMTIHITLVSQNIVRLYRGTASEAEENKKDLIKPTTDVVHYDDGYDEEVYGFDVPVPELKKEFDLALLGTHGNWYDHKVSVKVIRKLKSGEDEETALKSE